MSGRTVDGMSKGPKHFLFVASLLLAGLPTLSFGHDPNWSLRIGQKGPERLDRPGYPPVPLEPSDVTHEAGADSWTYHAKDSATGAIVVVHLTREACTDASNDTLTPAPPPSGKYSFRASVDHTQIGSLKGCARIAAELFPKINN